MNYTEADQRDGYQQAEQTANLLADGLENIARVIDDELSVNGSAAEATGSMSENLRVRATELRADRFKIIVIGGFNRGKSTLLNAILGTDILPQKVIPATAIITVIEFSDQPRVRIRFADENSPEDVLTLDEFRRRYVLSEDDFSEGHLETDRFSSVDHAVVSYPVELCRHRVELVDSPGLLDDQVRTARTKRFLKRADAVVMTLDATALLTEDEVHFLETVLLPEGLRNIFFVINKWNLVKDSVLRPEDASREFADLEARIKSRLVPFCVIDGKDHSAARIFRIDALGALKARMSNPPVLTLLEKSNVPGFESSLQRFLIEERGKAKNDIILNAIKNTQGEVNRFIATQQQMVAKSIAEVEAELSALQPKLERLRGIRQHILGFLDSQSSNLQDRLAISFQQHIEKIQARLPDEINKFNLSAITKKSMVWTVITDWTRREENKFARKVKNVIEPQLRRSLEQHFTTWRQSAVKNELEAVRIDVDKHLHEEATEYQRVIQEIEQQIGIKGGSLGIDEIVSEWLRPPGGNGENKLNLPTVGVLGDLSWVVGGIALDVAAEMMLHAAFLWIPVVGLIITAVRFAWRERTLRNQLNKQILDGVSKAFTHTSQVKTAEIRQHVREAFDELKQKIGGNINAEIALIEASLQSIIDRKREKEFSAEEEEQRLEAARAAIETEAAQIHAACRGGVKAV